MLRLLRALFDIINHLTDGLQFLRVLVGHFDPKLFFKGHYQFHYIERVCAQILNERGLRRDLFRVDAELLDDDVLDLLFDRFFRRKNLFGLC